VEPLSNYNVLVLDQRFRKTQLFPLSILMLLETVVFATETSALVWDLNTIKNTYNLSGNFKYSYVNDVMDKKGISTSLNIGKRRSIPI
jgi:hypothetical protein